MEEQRALRASLEDHSMTAMEAEQKKAAVGAESFLERTRKMKMPAKEGVVQ